ncbi:aminotransferase class IV [Parafilimonas sp.]|uniref:aminotransferase class IV n=1 Tax=Parafilimonas sp. TaxID=1969739 RepID=UPI003F7EA375
MRWVFINNDFFEEDKAAIQISDLSLQRGYGVFDFFRTGNNKPLFLEDYLDRFYHSAKAMFITVPLEREQLKEIIFKLIEKNNLPESGIRITATGGYSPDGYSPVEGNIIIQQQPLKLPPKEKYESGIKIITHEYLRDLPSVKSINYLMGVWLQKEVKEKQADDVLYYKHEVISEFPRSNIFIINNNGELLTPANNILAGITRKKVLELAKDIMPVTVRDITLTELKNAAEVFTTSTTKRLLPIVEIDGEKVGDGKPGNVTAALYDLFMKMENQQTTY